MITFVPYFRKDRNSVVVRVIVDGTIAKVINTGIKITSNQWDEKKKLVKDHPNKKVFNQKIQNEVNKLQREVLHAELLNVKLTKDRVKRLAEGGEITTDFYKHCKTWIEEKYTNLDTRKGAISDLDKVHVYAPSLQFGDMDKRWLIKYENYLRDTLKHKGNTVWKSMKFIRTMLYDAQETLGRKQIHNPFEEKEYVMPPYEDPDKDGLTIAELDKLESLLTENIPVVHKIIVAKFLFMCYTGLRISDAKRFTEEHLIDGRVVMTSKKTGTTTRLKIHDRLERVLNILKELPEKSFADKSFNEWLKVIAGMIDLKRIVLTSHVGRHTFGCLLAESGASQEEAMELMGVKDKNVVRVYYQLRQPQIDKAADKLNSL